MLEVLGVVYVRQTFSVCQQLPAYRNCESLRILVDHELRPVVGYVSRKVRKMPRPTPAGTGG